MASDVGDADVWRDLCKVVAEREPLDIDKVARLWTRARKLPAIDSPVDLSRDLRKFSQRGVALDSKELKGWWLQVQSSSRSLITRTPLNSKDWQYLMGILTCADIDVSRIEHLVLEFDDNSNVTNADINLAFDRLGNALSRRGFSKLKTLLLSAVDDRLAGPERGSLGDAIRGGGLVNLRTLWVPFRVAATVLNALAADSCKLSQLTSLNVYLESSHDVSTLDTIFKSGRLRSLQLLHLTSRLKDCGGFWKVFTKAIKSQSFPRLVCLYLYAGNLRNAKLADLFRESRKWFASLERLVVLGDITSKQVCSLVDAVMEDTPTQLALKNLGFPGNDLDNRAVQALASLVGSGKLPKLQALDLSLNKGVDMQKSLLPLLESIGKGRLLSLQSILWPESKTLTEADAKSVISAYDADHSLTTEVIGIPWGKYIDPSLVTKLERSRARNLRLAANREKLGEGIRDVVPLTRAKVFLCGYPKVGKTTLRRALIRPTNKLKETPPIEEPRTKGIEISKVEEKSDGKNVTLFLWDLAGQEEYHVLHGAFLTDLGFEGGNATTFVVVFQAPFGNDVKEKLQYWLRFAASSSLRMVKRHVVIVLNCFNGTFPTKTHQIQWKALIGDFAKTFEDRLHVHPDPFIIDVRTEVQPLKDHLVKHAQTLLQDVEVPRICFELADELKRWPDRRHQLPILTWQALEEMWKSKGKALSVAALKSAASYLHEIGEIIYFEDKFSKSKTGNKTIVVTNPEWFCRSVVGDLLLPKELLSKGDSSLKVGDDGCISLVLFKAFFQDLLVGGIQSGDVISMLELLGLCYKRGEQQIVVPALIRKNDYSSIEWEGKGYHEVMGRCLTAKDTDKDIIPVSLFRRLQVDLAEDENFGGRKDSGYKVGKSFVHFKYRQFLVLIQFDVNPSDPTDDRIDILIKSAINGDLKEVRSKQVEYLCDIMQKVKNLCADWCAGLTYDIEVIQPSSAARHSPHNMSKRKLLSLKTISDRLVKGEEYLGWRVHDQPVKTESLLSTTEIEMLVGTAERQYLACTQAAIAMGDSSPKDFLPENQGSMEVRSMSMWSDGNDQQHVTPKILNDRFNRFETRVVARVREIVLEDGKRTRQQIVKSSTELLLDSRRKHELLIKHIMAQQSFSSGEKVPRYMYLLRKQGESVFDKVKGAVRYTYHMHFLCEAHYDHGFAHPVEPQQEGIELKQYKDWVVRVSPWIRRTLQVGLAVATAVGNLYLPGLIPGLSISKFRSEESVTVVERALKILLDEHKGMNQSLDGDRNFRTPGKAITPGDSRVARALVIDLVKEIKNHVFTMKTGLRKVTLGPSRDEGSSEEANPSVAWICDNCHKNYKSNKGRHARLMNFREEQPRVKNSTKPGSASRVVHFADSAAAV